jgi:hypothetical protein
MTTVQDTLLYADGTSPLGTITLTWPAFQWAGITVAPGQQAYSIGSAGAISIELYPTVGAQPAGVYYTAVYKLDKGPVYREYWAVPSSPPVVTVGSVRTIPELIAS